MNPDRKFPFGVVATNNPLKDNRKRLLVSDFKSHSVMEIDEDGLGSIVGEYDNPGFDDGPQHKVDLFTLWSELHGEDRLYILLSISLIVKGAYDCFNI